VTSTPDASWPTPGTSVHRDGPAAVRAARRPPPAWAATIFSLNLATWSDDPSVAAVAGPDETAELAERLERRVNDRSTGVIGWWMRQLVCAAVVG